MTRALRRRARRGLVRTAWRGLLVLEEDGPFLRAALLTGHGDALAPVCVEPLEDPGALARFEHRLPRALRRERAPVLVVSSGIDVRLASGPGPPRAAGEGEVGPSGRDAGRGEQAERSCVTFTPPPDLRARWEATLAQYGRSLVGLYPLAGAPLGMLAPDDRASALLLQVERSLVAALELVEGRCVSLEVHRVRPTVELCREWIGAGRAEVLLCGSGLDLSALGYEIARGGSTWVRILGARHPAGSIAGVAALLGAARHACGLSAPVFRALPDGAAEHELLPTGGEAAGAAGPRCPGPRR